MGKFDRLCAAAGPACAVALIVVGVSGAKPVRSDIGEPVSATGAVPLAAKNDKREDESADEKPAKEDKAAKDEKPGKEDKPAKEDDPAPRNKPGAQPAPPPTRPPPSPEPECGAADRRVGDMRPEVAERAFLCVVNAERARRGASALVIDASLDRAAEAHSRDMVRRRYFAHDTKGGRTWIERVKAGGYVNGSSRYRIGETLAWAAGEAATARSRVDAWLESKPHRKVMLRKGYREVGIGIVRGTPAGVRGATFTADYGRLG